MHKFLFGLAVMGVLSMTGGAISQTPASDLDKIKSSQSEILSQPDNDPHAGHSTPQQLNYDEMRGTNPHGSAGLTPQPNDPSGINTAPVQNHDAQGAIDTMRQNEAQRNQQRATVDALNKARQDLHDQEQRSTTRATLQQQTTPAISNPSPPPR